MFFHVHFVCSGGHVYTKHPPKKYRPPQQTKHTPHSSTHPPTCRFTSGTTPCSGAKPSCPSSDTVTTPSSSSVPSPSPSTPPLALLLLVVPSPSFSPSTPPLALGSVVTTNPPRLTAKTCKYTSCPLRTRSQKRGEGRGVSMMTASVSLAFVVGAALQLCWWSPLSSLALLLVFWFGGGGGCMWILEGNCHTYPPSIPKPNHTRRPTTQAASNRSIAHQEEASELSGASNRSLTSLSRSPPVVLCMFDGGVPLVSCQQCDRPSRCS